MTDDALAEKRRRSLEANRRYRRRRGQLVKGSPEYRAQMRASKRLPGTPTYLAAHKRIHRERGKASSYGCISCPDIAREWSLSWRRIAREILIFDDLGRPYTADTSDYDPRCTSCARLYDRDFRRASA